MGISYEKEISIRCEQKDKHHLIEQALNQIGFAYTKPSDNIYEAKTSLNFKTSGENITIMFGNSDRLKVISRLKIGLVDWGRNKKNIEMFESAIIDCFNTNKKTESKMINDQSNDQTKSIISELIDNYKLYIAEIIPLEEFSIKKAAIISKISSASISVPQEVFILSLVELKDKEVITKDDILEIENNIA